MILCFYIISILSFCDYKWYNTIIPHSDAFCNVSNEKNMMNYESYYDNLSRAAGNQKPRR